MVFKHVRGEFRVDLFLPFDGESASKASTPCRCSKRHFIPLKGQGGKEGCRLHADFTRALFEITIKTKFGFLRCMQPPSFTQGVSSSKLGQPLFLIEVEQ